MTSNPYYELIQAAKGALLRLETISDGLAKMERSNLKATLMSFDLDGMASEAMASRDHLRDALAAVKETEK